MMKTAVYAALVLFPFLGFAENFCETCGRDMSPAKYASQCASCSVRESFGTLMEFFRSSGKTLPQVEEERRVRRLGKVAVWNFICVNQWFPMKIVLPSEEKTLNHSMALSVKDNPKRIRIVLKDAVGTIIFGGEKGKVVKHCGIYVLNNLPICLPGKNRMTLLVNRCAVDAIEYALIADDGTGRSRRTARGIAKSGEVTEFCGFH